MTDCRTPRPPHRRRTRSALAASLGAVAGLLLAAGAQAAGAVKVEFVEPHTFADTGPSPHDRERQLQSLQAHMQRWQDRLPDGQTLELAVLDVDLAGWSWPHTGRDLRVVTGRADAPSARLRWSLKAADGRVLQSGTERIIDLGYFHTAAWLNRNDGDLPYEKRLLDRWFSTTFPHATPASR